jgi:hypothetical protein
MNKFKPGDIVYYPNDAYGAFVVNRYEVVRLSGDGRFADCRSIGGTGMLQFTVTSIHHSEEDAKRHMISYYMTRMATLAHSINRVNAYNSGQ